MAISKQNFYIRFKSYTTEIQNTEDGLIRNINIKIEVCNNDNKIQKQNTNITLSIPYTPTISETEIYNELKKHKIYIKGLFGEQLEIDLTNSEDVFEEGQPEA